MKKYSLLQFLSEPLSRIIDNEEDYNFKLVSSSSNLTGSKEQYISSIRIPIIQRDYAQGRDDNRDLREEFINKLFYHLEIREELKLDFIYGSIEKNNTFLPLDGQQRLTTLFLLHYYIIRRETINDTEGYEAYKSILLKFSYETRDTSRRFFKELIDFQFEGNPRESIEKSYWYNDIFSLDPTIYGILNTLETIHFFYNESASKGSLLKGLKDNIIVFYVLLMDQFKLTDDLYIKLNARGKALTPFENFKADLVGFITNDSNLKLSHLLDDNVVLTHHEVIAHKIDNSWSDLFWSEAKKYIREKEHRNRQSVDTYFFRFIHRLLINNYIINTDDYELNKDSVYLTLQKKENELSYTNFDFYRKNNLIDSEFIRSVERLLDFYSIFNNVIQQNINPLWNKSAFKYSLFKEGNLTMDDRMIFDAINLYILNSTSLEFDEKKFKEWMRIVWNLISDPDIRSIGANKTVMAVIRRLASSSHDIYQKLVSGDLDLVIKSVTKIHQEQLLEEKQKADLILKGSKWEKSIYQAESHSLYEGNIGFLLNKINNPTDLENRFRISSLLFGDKKPQKLFDDEQYSLIRYILSQFQNWDDLKNYNFISTEINWKTNLRRNETVKNIILDLINLNDFVLIKNKVILGIRGDSNLNSSDFRQKIAHRNLFHSNRFHKWLQDDGVNSLSIRGNYIYIERSRSWYSRVMIDGYRNELIFALLKKYAMNPDNRELNDSGYYWGETLEFWKEIENDMKVSFYFDFENKLNIGLSREQNPKISNEILDEWIQVYQFDINDINDVEEIDNFIAMIENELKNDPDCKITSILN